MKQGIILVDKPADWTSFDVVNYVRKIVAGLENKKPKHIKVGHTGTLDPFATGLLILLIGKDYTRRASEFSKQDKTYEFSLCLGKVSTTGDNTGTITAKSAILPDIIEVELILKRFTGNIMQTPPQFSAIKVNGQRAYRLARAGQPVEIEPRPITIHQLKLIRYEYPELRLVANVSSGTYIRSLGEDIGEDLKTGAYVSSLRRDSIADYNVNDAILPQDINKDNLEQLIRSAS